MNLFRCSTSTKADHRFVSRMLITSALFAAFGTLAGLAFRFWHLKGWIAYPVAVLPALPAIAQIVAAGAYLAEEKDEFQRNLLVQCLLGGIGGTLAVVTTWGYLEDYAHVPRLDLILIWAIFWVFCGLTYPVACRRYR